jgi:tetratricopeptide (TPR) repeat protein
LDYGLALVFFALGLMSKPALVALPFALLLLDYWPLQRVSPASFRVSDWGRMVREKWPFFALTAASCVVTFVAMRRSGSVAPLASLSLPYRVENALLSYALYLGETIWPANLVLPRLLHKEIPWVQVAGATALLSGITWATWRARRQKPCLLVGWLWFLGMLVPVIGLVQQGLQAMADRYTYLPQIGLFLGVVFALGDWARAWHLRPAILILAAAAVLAGFQTATARQLRWWQDSETLFRHTLAVTKENHMASFNLGLALYGKGRVDEAIQCFRDVLKVLPDDVETHNDLAVALLKSGRRDEAVVHLRQAVALRPGNAEARCNLANVLLHMGQVDAAIAEYQKTLEYQPNFAGAHNNLGIVWFQQGKLDAAIAQFRETLRIDPGFVAAYGNLAEALLQKGRVDEAVTYYRKAVELQPDSAPARAGLAEALRREKTPGENLVLSTNGATNSPPATNRGGAIPAD